MSRDTGLADGSGREISRWRSGADQAFVSEEVFRSGKPIWPEGKEQEKNYFVGFRAVFNTDVCSRGVLRVAASTIYRAFLNGEFLGYGPARGPHGYYRVDEWDLRYKFVPGVNLIAIEVAGYNVNSYYLLDQPSFLQAEVLTEDNVLASTAQGDGAIFEAGILKERIQKVQRYSFQRPFSEAYRLRLAYDQWRRDPLADFPIVKCAIVPEKHLISRRVPYPVFSMRSPVWDVSCGHVRREDTIERLWKWTSLTKIGPTLKGFLEEELEIIPSIELQHIKTISQHQTDKPLLPNTTIKLKTNSFNIIDFGADLTGFIGARLGSSKNARIFFAFDEILSNGDIDFKRLTCVNIISYELQPGTYKVESFEPYTLRYLKLIALDGECEIEQIYIREYANPDVFKAHFSSSDRRLNCIFEAGRETFRQNALDVFMDCPSRERGAWLGDSFFTARVANDLSGNTVIEKNFFENYLLPDHFPYLPDGMLPMCYPADHNNGVFIPNLALWFVIQLEEYLARSGDRMMVDALKSKALGVFDYFKAFKNEYGLLENLKGWIFVDWSKANEFVQDVSYPTNMVYAAALEAAGKLYGVGKFVEEAEKVRDVIRQQSFDGQFFIDNALRKEGKLKVTHNRTEVCQYYAFFFGLASPKTHCELWTVLTEHFGPRRKTNNAFPEIYMTNAFMGDYLRLELLSRYGLNSKILEENKDHFLHMVNTTGTLWEFNDGDHSCNHGFASHVVHILYRDVLGVRGIDAPNKQIVIGLLDLPLDWCAGRIPVGDDAVSLIWWQEGNQLHYRVRMPAGFKYELKNFSDKEIVQHP